MHIHPRENGWEHAVRVHNGISVATTSKELDVNRSLWTFRSMVLCGWVGNKETFSQ
jgi:hypothetical protein